MATPFASRLIAEPNPGSNAPAVSVSELAGQLKRTVEEAYDHVRVRGEVSGWKRHASGHCYFTLKDDRACLDAVIWKGSAGALRFRPEDGLEVVATGRLTTYPGRSRYQVVVESLELAGAGALMALLDRRRRALAAEGLFAEEKKRPLPFLPRTIGVITSPTGAVIRDILHRLADRCPSHVLVWPVPVQGEGAAEAVAAAVAGFGAMESRPDLLIVARGGGSIEDLWAFNEEVVVRAVAASPIPVISAVGHETDTTLCDHAADKRAPTPTAAAEMAVPVRADLLHHLDVLGRRLGQCARRAAERRAERLDLVAARWPTPAMLFDPQRTRTTELTARLPRALRGRLAHARSDYQAAAAPLRRGLVDTALRRAGERVAGAWRLAELAHPERPLTRGYARVEANGRTLTTAAAARAAGRFTLHFGDGSLPARTDAPAPRTRPTAPATNQLDLLGEAPC